MIWTGKAELPFDKAITQVELDLLMDYCFYVDRYPILPRELQLEAKCLSNVTHCPVCGRRHPLIELWVNSLSLIAFVCLVIQI